jgi:hypothetical protein
MGGASFSLWIYGQIQARGIVLLNVKKSISILFLRKDAGVALAEDAIAVMGDECIPPIAKPFGDNAQDGRYDPPSTPEFAEHPNNRIRTFG